jgi:hypothetical protein
VSLSPRTTAEALAYLRQQHASGSTSWAGMCQKLARSSYGIGPLFGSAAAQWFGADAADKHAGGKPSDAPVGSELCYLGGKFGHIMTAANPFPSGVAAAWSNDLVVHGRVDKVARTAPITAWGHRYVGYITAINDVDLRMPQRQRYAAIEGAIERMRTARATAKSQGDTADVKVIDAEIARLQTMYDTLRRI